MNCPRCGHANPANAEFCQSCRTFLDWTEGAAAAPPAAAQAAPGAGTATAAPPTAPPTAPPVAPPVAASAPPEPPTPPPPPSQTMPNQPLPGWIRPPEAGEPPDLDEEAEGTGADKPPARRPDERVAAPARVQRQQTERRATGDLYCPECGLGNPRNRALCERCGSSLADATDEPHLPWYRWIARQWRRRYRAGERPAVRRRRRPRLALPIILILLLVAGILGRAQIGRLWTYVLDQTVKPKATSAHTHGVSSEAAGHKVGATLDGATNRYWMAATPGEGRNEFVDYDFPGPIRLMKIIISTGISADKDVFVTQGRPTRIRVETTTYQAVRSLREFDLADQPGPQTLTIRQGDVTRLRITVLASTGPKGSRVAIAEVEFFRR